MDKRTKLLLLLAAWAVADGVNAQTDQIGALAHEIDAEESGDAKPVAEPPKSSVSTGADALKSIGGGS